MHKKEVQKQRKAPTFQASDPQTPSSTKQSGIVFVHSFFKQRAGSDGPIEAFLRA